MDKLTVHEFHKFLKEQGLKSTRQRKLIFQVFLEAADHPSVEELYRRVRQKNSRIGFATVYRTLKLMAASGWASTGKFGDRSARFERCLPGDHHDHLICLHCGKIVEFENPGIENLQAQIARQKGFHMFDHKLEIYGYCAACAPQKHKSLSSQKKK
ncbi:MAG: Fur family transcriptional regulator [Thermodesulfobacteriota bacterium]